MTTASNIKSLGPPLHVKTQVVESLQLSLLAGCKVYLKLENTQPSASFKIRGIGHAIQKALANGCDRLVASSGGNAGLAAAYAAKVLKSPITIYVPESTAMYAREKLAEEGAEVVVHGAVWDIADSKAREEGAKPGCAYIPPFDHPDVWEGHASLIAELVEELAETPDLVVVSVGGGGLLCGLAEGMDTHGWGNVPILAMETVGADCFNQAIKAGKLVTLSDITSVAKRLGALTVTSKALDYYNTRPILSEVITDKVCVDAELKFLDDHRILVEPACSAAMASVYGGVLRRLQQDNKLPKDLRSIVIIVCGGGCVKLDELLGWKKQFDL